MYELCGVLSLGVAAAAPSTGNKKARLSAGFLLGDKAVSPFTRTDSDASLIGQAGVTELAEQDEHAGERTRWQLEIDPSLIH